MTILGMNKKVCHNLWVVYDVVNKTKYFYGAYRTEEKAKKIAAKRSYNYCYIK